MQKGASTAKRCSYVAEHKPKNVYAMIMIPITIGYVNKSHFAQNSWELRQKGLEWYFFGWITVVKLPRQNESAKSGIIKTWGGMHEQAEALETRRNWKRIIIFVMK